jgi:hypothetical protein
MKNTVRRMVHACIILPVNHYIAWLHDLGMADLERVGGKNASLGEMIRLSGLGSGAGGSPQRRRRSRIPWPVEARPAHRRPAAALDTADVPPSQAGAEIAGG